MLKMQSLSTTLVDSPVPDNRNNEEVIIPQEVIYERESSEESQQMENNGFHPELVPEEDLIANLRIADRSAADTEGRYVTQQTLDTVIVSSTEAVEEARRLSRKINNNVEADIKICKEESLFSTNYLSSDIFKTMYIIVDSNIYDIMFNERRLRDSVYYFFEEFTETSKVYLVNRLPENENVRYGRLKTQLPECVLEYKEITVTVEQRNTEEHIPHESEIDNHGDEVSRHVDEHGYHGNMEASGVPVEILYDKRTQGNLELDNNPADQTYVMVGSQCTMNIEKLEERIAIIQEGYQNTINVNIVPASTTSNLIVIIRTDPNNPVLEEELIHKLNEELEVINICLKIFDGSIVGIRKGSVVIEIDVKPGVTIGCDLLTKILDAIFSHNVASCIPKGTLLHLEADIKNAFPVSKLLDDFQSQEDVHKNCVDKEKHEAVVRELEALKERIKEECKTEVEMTEEAPSMSRQQRLLRLENQADSSSEFDRVYNYFSDDSDEEDAGKDGISDDNAEPLDRYAVHTDDGKSQDLNLKQYQLELAENAVHGRNTIICAPTGSGKTRVAMHVILKHLEQEQLESRPLKVVFLARTVPLVTQQFNYCIRFLTPTYKVMKLTGEDEGAMYVHQLMNRFDVVVMTPQVLVNQLKGEMIPSLTAFSMIVLDECHHTRKGEPYNNIMLRYLKEKKRDMWPHLPQIIGLTASLGVEKATTDEDAVNNIHKLMASMDTCYLSTVEQHIDELRSMVPVPEEKTFPLTEDRNDPARRVIENTMKKIEEMMLPCSAVNDKAIDSLLMKRPRERSSQPYGQWTVQIRNASRNVETGQSDGIYGVDVDQERADKARSLYVMADQLFRYNAVLEIHQMVRIKDVIFYLTKELGHICVRRNGKDLHVRNEKELQDLYTDTKMQLMRYEQSRGNDPRHNNPNLTTLSTTLLDLLKEKGFDSRTIIFVRTRATCEALVNWLNNDDHIPPELQSLHANIFTGAWVTEQEGGMTQVEQEEALSSFRDGTKKVLVATSVAEEGLDIPECNITIRYNHVGNEITTIQTRGRSRKAGGTSVLLGSNSIRQKEMLNVARADMMNRAITNIKIKPPDRILRIILGHQEQILQDEAINEMVRNQQQLQKTDTRFTLQCATCRTFCVSGNDLRTLGGNQHVVLDKQFEERVNIHVFRNSKTKCQDFKMTGSLQCKKCHKPWGVKFIHKQMSFSTLKIDYFNVMNQDTKEQSHYSTWKNFPYRINEMSDADFRRYSGAPDQYSSDDDDELTPLRQQIWCRFQNKQ